jgi:hypothetical protein
LLHSVHEFRRKIVILGALGMLAANAAVVLGAREILLRASTGRPHLDAILFFVLRFALISGVVLLAGVTRTLTSIPLGAAGALALAALLACRLHRGSTGIRLPDMGRPLLVLSGVILLRLVAQVWFFAPHNYDAISYHLTKVAEWVRAGGFTREMGIDTHAPFPAGFELIETWWVVFLHHDVLIEMAGVEYLLLSAVACYALARELDLPERWASFAAVAYALTPGLYLSATSCLNDVPVAALVLSAAALVQARSPWPHALLVAGLGLGTKPTFGYALPGVLLLAWLVRKKPALPPPPGSFRLAAAALAGVVGVFWYARNLLWFGSPIYPVGTRGLVASTGLLKIQFGPSPSSGLKNVLDLLQVRVYDSQIAHGPLLNNISGWGAVSFSCGLAATVIAFRNDPGLRRVALSMTLSLLCVLFLVNHDDWFMRFVLFFPAILSISAAKLAREVRPILAIAGVGLAFNFLATWVPQDLPLNSLLVLMKQDWRHRSAMALFGGEPPSSPVAFLIVEPVHNRGESYLLYGPDFARSVVYLRGSSAEDVRQELSRSGARILYRSRETRESELLVHQCLKAGFLKPLEGRFYAVALP